MYRFLLALAVVITISTGFRPASAQESQLLDPYKAILDRLEALTVQPEQEWRYHADVPHPEDPSLDDYYWSPMKAGDQWDDGSRVLIRWFDISEKLNGFPIRGS